MGCLVVEVGGFDVSVSEYVSSTTGRRDQRSAVRPSITAGAVLAESGWYCDPCQRVSTTASRAAGARSVGGGGRGGGRTALARDASRDTSPDGWAARPGTASWALERVDGGGSPKRRDGPDARHVARHVAGRLGREAGHSVVGLERVDAGGSPKRRDGPGARRVAEPTGPATPASWPCARLGGCRRARSAAAGG